MLVGQARSRAQAELAGRIALLTRQFATADTSDTSPTEQINQMRRIFNWIDKEYQRASEEPASENASALIAVGNTRLVQNAGAYLQWPRLRVRFSLGARLSMIDLLWQAVRILDEARAEDGHAIEG